MRLCYFVRYRRNVENMQNCTPFVAIPRFVLKYKNVHLAWIKCPVRDHGVQKKVCLPSGFKNIFLYWVTGCCSENYLFENNDIISRISESSGEQCPLEMHIGSIFWPVHLCVVHRWHTIKKCDRTLQVTTGLDMEHPRGPSIEIDECWLSSISWSSTFPNSGNPNLPHKCGKEHCKCKREYSLPWWAIKEF